MKTDMIKQNIVAFGIVCSMAFIGGCTSGSEHEQDPKELQVEAEIAYSTRAYDGTNYDQKKFNEGDKIGINKGTDMDVDGAKKYVRTGTKWIPEGADRWAVTGTAGETFSAYYPLEYTGILADQTTPASFWQSNLLKADGVAPQGNVVAFTFQPVYSKVTLNITYVDAQTPTQATIGALNITGAGDDYIQLYRISGSGAMVKHSYVGIFKPGTFGLRIDVTTTPGGAKIYTHSSSTYQPGRNYIFNFTSKDELILNGVTVAAFTATDETDAGNAM